MEPGFYRHESDPESLYYTQFTKDRKLYILYSTYEKCTKGHWFWVLDDPGAYRVKYTPISKEELALAILTNRKLYKIRDIIDG